MLSPMWWMLLSSALAAPLSEVAAEAVALQRARGEPVVVALPDAPSLAAWSRLELPSDALLVPTVASSEAEAFEAVQGLECGVMVLAEAPGDYAALPFGACGSGGAHGATAAEWTPPSGWESTHDWGALGLSASTLLLVPKLHFRAPSAVGMLGITAGYSWLGPRLSLQLSTRPRQGGTGLYVGGEGTIRTVEALTVAGSQQAVENGVAWGNVLLWREREFSFDETLVATVPAFCVAPILGTQYIGEKGLFLAAQGGPQLQMLIGGDLISPVRLRVSVQLLVGVVPKRWRGRSPGAG